MRLVKLLFKRDILEEVSSLKKKADIIGMISSLLLILVVYAVFIYVFRNFANMYMNTVFGDYGLVIERIKEIFTISFSIVFIINVIVGIKKMYNVLTDVKDNDVLIYQPINTGSIFIYKLIKVYLSQVLSTAFIILPITIVMDGLSSLLGGVGYYLLVALIVLLIPFISAAFASLLSIPYLAIMKKISSKFIIMLGIYVVIVAIAFLLYGSFLNVLSELVRSGNIKYAFDYKTIESISNTCIYLYPSNFFTNIIMKNHTMINILIVIAISIIAVIVAYTLVKKIYIKIIQNELEGTTTIYKNKAKLKVRNPFNSLLYKEFLVVLRTPTYAFQYFAMAITLPFMVYVCAYLLESMLSTLTIIDCNYALAIFVVSMFSILTNTFCTTNISRDGKMFAMMKTMPVTIHEIINVKLVFCSIVSLVSVFVSCFVLLVTGYLNISYFLITFIIGFLFSLVQIAYATRKDMKKPNFPNNNQQEILEGNSNMSTLILGGLALTVISGGGSVLLSVVLGMKYNQLIASVASIGFVFVVTVISLIVSFIYLHKGIDKEYYIKDI